MSRPVSLEVFLLDILLSNKSVKQALRIFQREELIPKYKCVLLQLMPYLISLISFVVRLTLLIDMMGCCRSVSSNVFLAPLSLVGKPQFRKSWRGMEVMILGVQSFYPYIN